MRIEELFDRRRFIILDGGMGTQLQQRGLQPGQLPELAAFTMPRTLEAIHRDYAAAGADVLLANTFGINEKKLEGSGYRVEQAVAASVACARRAAALCRAGDALEAVGLDPAAAAPTAVAETAAPLSPDAAAALAALGPVPRTPDEVAAAAGLPIQRALVALAELEFAGAAAVQPGHSYIALK